MKGSNHIAPGTRMFALLTVLTASLTLLQTAHAQYTLTDGNSTVIVNPATQQGMQNWTVDGINNLFQQWFWYRVGPSGLQHSIDTISAPVVTQTANTLNTVYNANTFNISVLYSLRGGAAGSGVSDVGEQITINNTSASSISFHLFQYSDFDLGGTAGGDTVQLGKSLTGKYNEALQWKGNMSLTETFADTVATPGADHGEAALFAQTLNELNYTNALVLNDNSGPVGPGDATWAFEWDLNIAAGGSVIISKDKNLSVPEPSILAMLTLGMSAWLFRRRA